MLIATTLAASSLIALAILHLMAARFFSGVLASGQRSVNPAFQPSTAVLMSVRGCDPSLEKCLRGLLDQTCENYRVHVIVDHVSDDAWGRVHQIKREFDSRDRIVVLELEQPGDSCSLKCSALIQGLGKLSGEPELVVLIDADVIPHREWLMQAISPLEDPSVGVVTGNQWFEPEGRSVGSLMRSLWNAGSLVPTATLANPWAGTCAMRLADVGESGLVEVWKRSIVDDGPIREAYRPLGKQIVFNPDLIMVNRENCTVGYVNRYVPRMLTWSRIHEPTFVHTLLYTVILVGCWLATGGLMVAGLLTGQWAALIIGAAGMAANTGLNLLAYLMIRRSIQGIGIRPRTVGHPHGLGPLGAGRIVRLAALIPVCQLAFGAWMVRALLTRRVHWRQITYEVRASDQIRMVRYRPMNAGLDPTVSEVSI